ncbi:MAG: hypothetical protein AB7E80_09260 [Hyphomicrobiaceae bacterium]
MIAASLLAGSGASAAEFSADVVETRGGFNRSALLWVKGTDTLLAYQANGLPVIQISRPSSRTYRIVESIPRIVRIVPPEYAEMRGGDLLATDQPCKASPGTTCTLTGGEDVDGVVAELYQTGPEGGPGLARIWWDASRRMALRIEFNDGRAMRSIRHGDTTYEALSVETWEQQYLISGQQVGEGQVLFAPDLGVAVLERRPDGSERRLVNITTEAVDDSLFEVPEEYREVPFAQFAPPASEVPQAEAGAPAGGSPAEAQPQFQPPNASAPPPPAQ